MGTYIFCQLFSPSKLFVDNSCTSPIVTKLQRGSNREVDIIKLQQALNQLGYTDKNGNPLEVDGYFGENTEYAVNCYKNDNNLYNEGDCAGVVGVTTWEHLGLEVDNAFEVGASSVGQITANALYFNGNGPNINRGISLFDAEAGLVTISDDYKYGGWAVDAVNGSVQASIDLDYIGAEAFASTVSGEIYLTIPIPFTESNFVVTGSGHLLAIGGEASIDIENKEVSVKIAMGVGAGLSLSID